MASALEMSTAEQFVERNVNSIGVCFKLMVCAVPPWEGDVEI